jgi:SNF2 family DNA or RNA helicase
MAAQKANVVNISEELLAFIDEHGFDGREAVVERLNELSEALAQEALRAATAEQASRAHDTDRPVALSDNLYPFQRAGVAYVVDHAGGRAIIGDEMGLGKTRQGLSVLETTESYPAVSVCPAHLKSNWLKETKALLPHRSVEVLKGTAVHRTTADIVIINYDILSDWVDAQPDEDGEPEYLAPQGLVLDESHYVKNDAAQRTSAAKRLASRVPQAGCVVLLTGTPVLNRPAEIISQLEIINSLSIFGRNASAPTRTDAPPTVGRTTSRS